MTPHLQYALRTKPHSFWSTFVSREEALTFLQDEEKIVGVCWYDDRPEVEIEAEMTFADDEEQEPKGLVWNISAMDGTFCGNEGSPEMALVVAEALVMDRHGIPQDPRGR